MSDPQWQLGHNWNYRAPCQVEHVYLRYSCLLINDKMNDNEFLINTNCTQFFDDRLFVEWDTHFKEIGNWQPCEKHAE